MKPAIQTPQIMRNPTISRSFYTASAETDRAEELRRWLKDGCTKPEVPVRNVPRLAPIRALRESPAARAALGMLERHGCLVPLEPGTAILGTPRKNGWRVVRTGGDVF